MSAAILHEYTLPSGKKLVFRELGLRQLAMIEAKPEGLEQTLHGLRLSLVKIGDEPVDPDKLAGEKIGDYLTLKEFAAAQVAWLDIHVVSEEELTAVKKSGKSSVGGI